MSRRRQERLVKTIAQTATAALGVMLLLKVRRRMEPRLIRVIAQARIQAVTILIQQIRLRCSHISVSKT